MNKKSPVISFVKILTPAIVILLSIGLKAQKSEIYFEETENYRKALDLFEKEKYGSAQFAFQQIADNHIGDRGEIVTNSEYYKAVCGLMLFNNNAENLLIEFITEYPESPKVNRSYFDLGKYQYRKKRFGEAISWFEKVNSYNLSNEDLAEYYFKLGYSYFKEERRKEALQALFEIKDADTKYSVVAKYYFAHISYETDNLEQAMKYFREIEYNSTFSSIIPYYITHILFRQGKYEMLISYASAILDSVSAQRAAEISKLIGESYFRMGKYKEALPYLIGFTEGQLRVLPEDYYGIAFSYYRTGEYGKAVKWYQKALSDDDSLNQIIQYNMAEAYLALGEKRLGRESMRTAYLLNKDDDITENALYAYAKLSYELSKYPFNDAIRAFEEYMNKYPKSAKIDEANEYLVGVYFNTRNYEEARKSLDRIKNRGLKLNLAYQRILYYLGVENMNKGLYEPAIAYFDMAINENYDRSVGIEALFWKAEAYFRLVKYDISIETYKIFLLEPGARSSDYYNLALYNLGYAHYRTRDYKMAIFRFRQFISVADSANGKLINDACLRTADAYFITRDYQNAADYYDKAIGLGPFERDYAIYQSALASGVMGDYTAKISKLEWLKKDYRSSLYYDDALFELGEVQLINGSDEASMNSFEQLMKENSESPYYSRALLKTGLIFYNRKNDSLALERFEKVVRNFRNSTASREALEKIKQIYMDRSDLSGFEKYMKGLGIEDISVNSMDSASYEIAENAFMSNKCQEAVRNFTIYIDKYSSGLFLLNAHYYRAECELKSGFKEEALIDYEYVTAQPKNLFTEKALLQSARLSREAGKTAKAIAYYLELEKKSDLPSNRDQAQYWLMKLYFEDGRSAEGLKYAEEILKKDNLSAEVRNEIMFLSGKAYLKNDQYNKAFRSFKELESANDEKGAAGKFNLAYIEYMRGNLDSSEKYIAMVLNQVPSYDYWIARSFILWSDIYLAREDVYQSKVSLHSVLENFEGKELVDIAKEKLKLIEDQEKSEKEEVKVEKKFEINFGEQDYDYLFDEEEIEE